MDVTQTIFVDTSKNTKKLDSLVDKSRRVLIRVTSVFPFDFFPDSIIVDESKVNIVSRIFFYSEKVFTVMIPNIKGVSVSSNLFFATVEIQVSPLEVQPAIIKFLRINHAHRVRRIIMGLVACHEDGIDVSKFDRKLLAAKVEEIGRTRAT